MIPAEFRRFPNHWNVLPFLKVFKDATSGNTKLKKEDFLVEGSLPIVDQGQAHYGGFTNDVDSAVNSELPAIVFGDHTRAFKFIEEPFALGADGAKLLEPIVDADKKYLFYYLKQLRLESAGYSRHYKFLKETYIPLPPLAVQKQIASVLEKADTLRNQCQQMEQELNTLAQSVFLDMFGDPVSNPKKWDVRNLDSICIDIYRYPTFYGFDYVENGAPVVKIGNITQDGYVGSDLSLYDFMPYDICEEYPRTILKMHDIVMAVRGDGSTGKRIGLVDSEVIVGANISPNLIMFRSNEQIVHPIFLYYFLTSSGGQAKIEKYISKTAKKTITGKDIKKIEMFVPPMDIQNKFVEAYKLYREQLNNNSKVKTDSSALFKSLLQRAFNGELNLKYVA